MAQDGEPHGNSHDTLKLSDEYVRSLLNHVAQTLIFHGRATINSDSESFMRSTDKTPYSFSYEVPAHVARDIFLRDSDDIIVSGARVEYAEPYRLNKPPYDDEIASLYMSLTGKLQQTDIDVRYQYYISDKTQQQESTYSSIEVDYTQNGVLLSRNTTELPDDQYEDSDVLHYAPFLHAMEEEIREMTVDDADRVRQLMEYIQLHPQHD